MCLPFDDLKDRTLGKGVHLGFEWEIVKNMTGHRCGYVRVEPGHPWFEKEYDDVSVDVHGGLTFADHGKACPTHGEKAEWWLGFDCAHYMDAPDPELMSAETKAFNRKYGLSREGVVRGQGYVEAECRSLCEQAAAAT